MGEMGMRTDGVGGGVYNMLRIGICLVDAEGKVADHEVLACKVYADKDNPVVALQELHGIHAESAVLEAIEAVFNREAPTVLRKLCIRTMKGEA